MFDLEKLEITGEIRSGWYWTKKTSDNSAISIVNHRYFNIVDQSLEWISKLSSGHSDNHGFRRGSGHQMIVIDRGKWWVSQRGVAACKIPRTSWPHRLAIQRDPGLGLDVITLLTPAIAFNPRSSSSYIDSAATRTGNDRGWKERDQSPCWIDRAPRGWSIK